MDFIVFQRKGLFLKGHIMITYCTIAGLSRHFLGQGLGPSELGKLSSFWENWERLPIPFKQ